MKIVNLFLAALFVLFALAQVNDLDPWGWGLFYLFIANVCAFAAFGKFNKWILFEGLAICVIWALSILPEFIAWIQIGMPTITGQMKATEPHVEFTREFLGIFISAAVLVWQFLRYRKLVRSGS